jgi:hypothetical protein
MFRGIQRLLLFVLSLALAFRQAGNRFAQSILVSDGSVKAQTTDPQLINSRGIAIGQQTPFWINTAGSGFSKVHDAGGNKQFIVRVSAAGVESNTGSSRGIAFNTSTTDFHSRGRLRSPGRSNRRKGKWQICSHSA